MGRDDVAGIAPNNDAWERVLPMADSFYSNPAVEENQNPVGVGLLSLLALEQVTDISKSSRGETATIETSKLWNYEDYRTAGANLLVKRLRHLVWTEYLGEIETEQIAVFDSTILYFLNEEKHADCRYKFIGDYQESFDTAGDAKSDERPSFDIHCFEILS